MKKVIKATKYEAAGGWSRKNVQKRRRGDGWKGSTT